MTGAFNAMKHSSQSDATLRDPAPPLLFLVNVDWFFISHFIFLAERLVAEGRRVLVLAEDTGRFADIKNRGINTIALPARRNGLFASGTIGSARVVQKVLDAHPGAVLHGFGVFGILTGAIARIASPGPTLFTITGLGYMAAAETTQSRLLMRSVAQFSQRVADRMRPHWVIENADDARALGLSRAEREGRVHLVGGAGVDIARHAIVPMPPLPPLKLATVARLIWSKGIDIAVAAIAEARNQGVDVTLTVAGEPDPHNPRSFDASTLAKLAAIPGVTFSGFVHDVPALLAAHHGVVLASRGGEGVPKGLIEASASARVIVTTDVPGCRSFAEETGGWWAPCNDVSAIARAFASMASAPDLAARGLRARQIVEVKYTHDAVWQKLKPFYACAHVPRDHPSDMRG